MMEEKMMSLISLLDKIPAEWYRDTDEEDFDYAVEFDDKDLESEIEDLVYEMFDASLLVQELVANRFNSISKDYKIIPGDKDSSGWLTVVITDKTESKLIAVVG